MTIEIRPETGTDHAAVAAVNRRAFGRSAEAVLVAALRTSALSLISLVAERDGVVVGHILFSPVRVEGSGGAVDAVALAPVAVDPAHQGRGVGSRLVRAGLEACRAGGHAAVFVLGHPKYYPRFGFAPASGHGIRCEFPVPEELFFALELRPGALRGVTGTVRYHPEFSRLEEESP
jgi:putative acetyltransferase